MSLSSLKRSPPSRPDGTLPRKELDSCFGPPALLPGESQGMYNSLYSHVRAAVAPADFIEEIFLRDLVDLEFEVLRLRRFKSHLVASRSSWGLRVILERVGERLFPLLKEANEGQQQCCSGNANASSTDKENEKEETEEVHRDPQALINQMIGWWGGGDFYFRALIIRVLEAAGYSEESIMAETLAMRIEELERLDLMIGRAEARRNDALKEIDRRRSAFASRFRAGLGDIEDITPEHHKAPVHKHNGVSVGIATREPTQIVGRRGG